MEKLLYEVFGLSARDMAEVMVDVAEVMIDGSETDMIKVLSKKYEGKKKEYALYLAGKINGMFVAYSWPHTVDLLWNKLNYIVIRIIAGDNRDDIISEVKKEIEKENEWYKRYMFEKRRDVV